MSFEIVASLVLLLITAWLVPLMFKMDKMAWMLGPRDTPLDASVHCQRAIRAAENYKESLPAFLALALLAQMQNVDVSQWATYWLIARVVFIPCYVLGITYVRTLVWTVALACLVMMGMAVV
jgi:uncharacterized MAPEG superfamily protein